MWAAHQAIIIALLVYPVHTVDEQSGKEETFRAFYTCHFGKYFLMSPSSLSPKLLELVDKSVSGSLGTEDKVPQNKVGASLGEIMCRLVFFAYLQDIFQLQHTLVTKLGGNSGKQEKLRAIQGIYRGNAWVLHGKSRGNTKRQQRNKNGNPGNIQGQYRGNTEKIQGKYKGNTGHSCPASL